MPWFISVICAPKDFHNEGPNWDFKNLGCPKSPIEKVKIITLIMYINKTSNYMLNSPRNVFVIMWKLKLS